MPLNPENLDYFGPLTKDKECVRLPEDIHFQLISKESDIEQLDFLLEEKYVGVDSEWRPNLTTFHKTKVALFQISGAKAAFLIDFVSLGNNPRLDDKLVQIFSCKSVTIVGFSFDSDVHQLSSQFPLMKFYRYIANFIDAQEYYRILLNDETVLHKTGLAKVVE